MFWFGFFVALVSGLVSIAALREVLLRRYPGLRELHLDVIGAVLLIIGLALAAYDHVATEAELRRLETLASPPKLSYASHRTRMQESGLIEAEISFRSSKPEPLGLLSFEATVEAPAEIAEFMPAGLAMQIHSQIHSTRRSATLQFATPGGSAPALKINVTAPTTVSLEEAHLPEPVVVMIR